MSTKQIDRAYRKVVIADLGVANIGAGNEVTAAVPPNALVLSVALLTTTAFDTGSTGTATASIADGTTTFVNAQDVKTVGSETVAVSSKYYPAGGTITFSVAETVVDTSATVGRALGTVEYVIVGGSEGGIQE